MSTQFNCPKSFLFQAIQFSQTILFQIQFTLNTQFRYKTVLFQAVQFSISKQFNSQKYFYFKQFSLVKEFQFKPISSA